MLRLGSEGDVDPVQQSRLTPAPSTYELRLGSEGDVNSVNMFHNLSRKLIDNADPETSLLSKRIGSEGDVNPSFQAYIARLGSDGDVNIASQLPHADRRRSFLDPHIGSEGSVKPIFQAYMVRMGSDGDVNLASQLLHENDIFQVIFKYYTGTISITRLSRFCELYFLLLVEETCVEQFDLINSSTDLVTTTIEHDHEFDADNSLDMDDILSRYWNHPHVWNMLLAWKVRTSNPA